MTEANFVKYLTENDHYLTPEQIEEWEGKAKSDEMLAIIEKSKVRYEDFSKVLEEVDLNKKIAEDGKAKAEHLANRLLQSSKELEEKNKELSEAKQSTEKELEREQERRKTEAQRQSFKFIERMLYVLGGMIFLPILFSAFSPRIVESLSEAKDILLVLASTLSGAVTALIANRNRSNEQ